MLSTTFSIMLYLLSTLRDPNIRIIILCYLTLLVHFCLHISHTDFIYVFSLENSLENIAIVITLITEEEGSKELLEYVEDEMQRLETQLNFNISIDNVDRFGRRMYVKI